MANELSVCVRSAQDTQSAIIAEDLVILRGYGEFQLRLTGYLCDRIQGRNGDGLEAVLKAISDFGKAHSRRELQFIERSWPNLLRDARADAVAEISLESILETRAARTLASLAEQLTVCARSAYRHFRLSSDRDGTDKLSTAVYYNELLHSLLGCLMRALFEIEHDGLARRGPDIRYIWLFLEDFGKKRNVLADLETSLNRAYSFAKRVSRTRPH